MSYDGKAMTAIREGDQLATRREVDFKELLDKFAIGCREFFSASEIQGLGLCPVGGLSAAGGFTQI